jgi:hypothetical protein
MPTLARPLLILALEGCEGHANGEDAVEFVVGRYPGILLTSSEFD